MSARRAFAIAAMAMLVLVVLNLGFGARWARADGAFPGSLQVLLPTAQPQQIVLSTNFGLIISDDAGATWQWTCEQAQTFGSSAYGLGPGDRMFALSSQAGLAFSDDLSCTWTVARGA